MTGLAHIGRVLIVIGVLIAVAGAYLACGGRVPLLGRLPGDILFVKRGLTIFIPVTTSIIISVILTCIFIIIGRR